VELFDIFLLASRWIFLLALAYYLMTNLQWYNYKILRVLFKHHKIMWHFFYFFVPIVFFYALGEYFYVYLYGLYIPSLIYWTIKLDKQLVITGRIKRFWALLVAFMLFGDLLCYAVGGCKSWMILMPLLFSLILSTILEGVLLNRYAEAAKDKLNFNNSLKIIAITGSYGKTSLKNFLAYLLGAQYSVYATPRSVNTFAGIVADINTKLPMDTDYYIVEAGARGKGDILEITNLIQHHYAILGKIGEAHIEYFKTIDAIKEAKSEILASRRLEYALIYENNHIYTPIEHELFPKEIRELEATLEGTRFELLIDGKFYSFSTAILGAFNAINLSAAIAMAYKLHVPIETIQKLVSELTPTPHRLQKIQANNRVIIDDSFNGNIEGMLEGIRLASLYEGRKIIVTPGLVESSDEANTRLALAIDSTFDIAIITGDLNAKLLSRNITRPQKIIVKEKELLAGILSATTCDGDFILFANDAPSYI